MVRLANDSTSSPSAKTERFATGRDVSSSGASSTLTASCPAAFGAGTSSSSGSSLDAPVSSSAGPLLRPAWSGTPTSASGSAVAPPTTVKATPVSEIPAMSAFDPRSG